MCQRILIIEDDADISAIERDYLEINGYETVIAETGPDGMKEALTENYDLIILDIMLPGMDGFEVCRNIRDRLDKNKEKSETQLNNDGDGSKY